VAAIKDPSEICSIKLMHVEGHQDEDPVRWADLSNEARLNIHCDSMASIAFPSHRAQRSANRPSPKFPVTKCHLPINNKIITSKLAAQM